MKDAILLLVLGIIVILIGISNTRGNISTIHSYHRKRVSEQDRIPFGKTVGLGTIICGVSTELFGVGSLLSEKTQTELFSLVGTVLLIVGLVLGLGISFYGMIKYNKGIF